MSKFAAVPIVVLALGSGCAPEEESTPEKSSAVALVAYGARSKVVFVNAEDAARASSILQGEAPRDFYWASIELPLSEQALAAATDGVHYDLTTAGGSAGFAQVYPAPCNPALGDYAVCRIYESYQSGDSSLTGRMFVRLDEGMITASVEVSWEGVTDRFGAPPQWHQHSTSGSYVAPVTNVAGTK